MGRGVRGRAAVLTSLQAMISPWAFFTLCCLPRKYLAGHSKEKHDQKNTQPQVKNNSAEPYGKGGGCVGELRRVELLKLLELHWFQEVARQTTTGGAEIISRKERFMEIDKSVGWEV